MKRFQFVLAFFFGVFIFPLHAKSQEVHDIGVHLGSSSYLGDFNNINIFKNPSFRVGAHYRYNFSDYSSIRASLSYGQIKGGVSGVRNYLPSVPADFQFQQSFLDLEIKYEANFLPFDPLRMKDKNFSPYLFAGIGLSFYDGNVLPTIPFGVGVKYSPLERLTFALEMQFSKTFTDELDYYSNLTVQKSLLINNDWFVFCGLVVSYRLKWGQRICPVYL